MNKKIGILAAGVGILIATSLVATWYAADQTRKHYESAVTELTQWLGDKATVSTSYQRGFWTAQARTTVQWKQAQGSTLPNVRLNIDSTIHHGPWAGSRFARAVVQTRLTLDGSSEEALAITKGASAPTITLVNQWNGDNDATLLLPAGEWVDGKDALRWGELRYTLAANAARTLWSGSLQWPSATLHLTDMDREADGTPAPGSFPAGITLAMQGLSSHFEMQVQDGFWLLAPGQSTLRVGNIHAGVEAHEGPFSLHLEGTELQSVVERTGDLFKRTLTVKTQGQVGSVAVEQLALRETMDRLDIQALRGFQDALIRLLQQPKDATGTTPLGLDAQTLPRLLAAKPSYAVNLQAKSGGQQGQLHYALAIDSAPEPQLLQQKLWNMLLLRNGNLQADFRLPTLWVHKVASSINHALPPQTLDLYLSQLQQQGLILLQDDTVSSTLELVHGALKVNGHALKLPGQN